MLRIKNVGSQVTTPRNNVQGLPKLKLKNKIDNFREVNRLSNQFAVHYKLIFLLVGLYYM